VIIRVRSGDAASATAEMVILPLAGGEEDGDAVRALMRRGAGVALRRAIAAARFRGREGQVATLPLGDPKRRTLCLVGLGDPARLDLDAWRRAAGLGRKAAEAAGARRVAIVVGDRAGGPAHLVALVEGFRLAGYRFDKYKSEGDVPPPVEELILMAPAPPAEKALAPAWEALETTLGAVATARDLVNEPAAVKTPAYLAAMAERLGEEAGITVEVWDPARLEAERMAGILAVARGSSEEPRFIRLRYCGAEARRRVALVGKGITFDSGGLSLKPAKSMETMKTDMAGGAAVLAVMVALGRLRPAIEVEGFIPATENLPSGRAQKPGDVIRFRTGKTVEVVNTDAEGRLILADALALAAAGKPDVIVDLATLTGACVIALGAQVAGVFGNHQPLVDRLIAAGRETGEPLWQLPLVPEYRDDIKSAVADLKNVGGGNAGSITAALFLQEFVDGAHWAHLDIAGPAFTEKDLPYMPKGGTGFGVRTILRYLSDLAADDARQSAAVRSGTSGAPGGATRGTAHVSGSGTVRKPRTRRR
jgi:leucyl aminopeptidase